MNTHTHISSKENTCVLIKVGCRLPGGKRPYGGPEAGHSPGPALPEGLFYQLALRGGVDPPERAFARLLLRAGHFDEIPVQGQVVADRVLKHTRHTLRVTKKLSEMMFHSQLLQVRGAARHTGTLCLCFCAVTDREGKSL